MAVYNELKAYCLDGQVWSLNKAYDTQKDGQQATANIHNQYEGNSEVNMCVAWATANIYNTNFIMEQIY